MIHFMYYLCSMKMYIITQEGRIDGCYTCLKGACEAYGVPYKKAMESISAYGKVFHCGSSNDVIGIYCIDVVKANKGYRR